MADDDVFPTIVTARKWVERRTSPLSTKQPTKVLISLISQLSPYAQAASLDFGLFCDTMRWRWKVSRSHNQFVTGSSTWLAGPENRPGHLPPMSVAKLPSTARSGAVTCPRVISQRQRAGGGREGRGKGTQETDPAEIARKTDGSHPSLYHLGSQVAVSGANPIKYVSPGPLRLFAPFSNFWLIRPASALVRLPQSPT